jgi:glucuronate isomerase
MKGSAPGIWEEANEKLAGEDFRALGILKHFRVEVACTTDDPVDSLEDHLEVNKSAGGIKMLPTFRPDKALAVETPEAFQEWVKRLGNITGKEIINLDDFLQSLDQRHEDFHQAGGRLSDHGLEHAYGGVPDRAVADRVFSQVLAGGVVSSEHAHAYKSFLMVHFGQLDASKSWTKQMHLGAYRNVNSAKYDNLGPDKGFDSIGDFKQGRELGSYFDQLERIGAMPKAVIYNHNPVDNYLFATLAGNFQDGEIPGKVQFGSGWWFLDQKEGMEAQINALSSLGLLSRFVGMLTDSRSFLSFPRHEYFRRILCNLIGKDMDEGLIPDDFSLSAGLVSDVCYHNARNYFGFYED